jgi:hypothetical protein
VNLVGRRIGNLDHIRRRRWDGWWGWTGSRPNRHEKAKEQKEQCAEEKTNEKVFENIDHLTTVSVGRTDA